MLMLLEKHSILLAWAQQPFLVTALVDNVENSGLMKIDEMSSFCSQL